MQLDPTQQEIVDTDWEHIVAIAGAGSGKTTAAVARAKRLLASGVDPEQLVMITFTKRGAAEMRRRIRTEGVTVTTIHALCAGMIRDFPQISNRSPNFDIWSDTDKRAALERCAADAGEKMPKRDPSRILKLPAVAARFNDLKRECDALDFDDLEVEALKVLETHGDHYRDRWPYVIVDEWQDTSLAQMQIIDKAWRPEHRMKVGDPRQGIYRWRNARLENILDLLDDFDVDVHYMLRNYRSTPEIVEVGNLIAAAMGQEWAKPMEAVQPSGPVPTVTGYQEPASEADAMAEAVADQIARGVKPGRIAVLARTWTVLHGMSVALSRKEIMWGMGRGLAGKTIWGSPSARWLISAMRFCRNPNNDWELEQTMRGMWDADGRDDVEAILAEARREAAAKSDSLVFQLPKSIHDEMWSLRESVMTNWSDVTDAISAIDDIRCLTPLDDSPGIVSAVDEWSFDRSGETVPDVGDFLEWVALAELEDGSLSEDDSGGVVLSTVHGAKGEEYECVHVVGVCEGVWPSERNAKVPWAVGEDRRLLYVACTRAERELRISYPSRYATGPIFQRTERSRYLNEMEELAGGPIE